MHSVYSHFHFVLRIFFTLFDASFLAIPQTMEKQQGSEGRKEGKYICLKGTSLSTQQNNNSSSKVIIKMCITSETLCVVESVREK